MARNSQFNIQFHNFVKSNGLTEGGETLTIQVAMQFVIHRSLLGMEKRKEEYLNIACQIYMASILVVLPLYYIPGNG